MAPASTTKVYTKNAPFQRIGLIYVSHNKPRLANGGHRHPERYFQGDAAGACQRLVYAISRGQRHPEIK